MASGGKRGGWKLCVSFDGTELHLRPRDDLMYHPLDSACFCGPQTQPVERIDGVELTAVIHHSLDGREQDEESG